MRPTASRLIRSAAVAALATAVAVPAASAARPRESAVGGRHSTETAPRRLKIVGGGPAGSLAWPWMASIELQGGPGTDFDRHFCGGTLVAPRLVVTAAHCLFDRDGYPVPSSSMEVVLGKSDLNAAGGERLAVARAAAHPDYRDAQNGQDVAVLVLAAPSHQPVAQLPVPGTPLHAGDTAMIEGWGSVASDAAGSPVLKAATVPLTGFAACRGPYPTLNPATNICAGYPQGGTDTCQGDSGGPLMLKDADGTWRLTGVTSWGDECAKPGSPGVYTWVDGAAIRAFIRGGLQAAGSTPLGTAPEVGGPVLDRVAVRRGRRVVVRFGVSARSKVKVAVLRRSHGRLVRLLESRGAVDAGAQTVRLYTGQLRRGRYLIGVQARDGLGRRSDIAVTPLRIR